MDGKLMKKTIVPPRSGLILSAFRKGSSRDKRRAAVK